MQYFKNSRGVTLTIVTVFITLLSTILGVGLLSTRLDLKTTAAFKTSTITLHAADTGLQHALAVIPSGTTFPYTAETTILDSVPFGDTAYTLKAVNDPASGGSRAILTSTAQGMDGSKKVIVAYVGRGTYALGAVSLPGSIAASTETNFSGTSFTINGNDYCNSAPVVPGIVVTDPGLALEITNYTTSDGGLASNQMGNVIGAWGTPSVIVVASLSKTVSEMADEYLSLSHVDLPGGNYSGNGTWGTQSSPRITRINGNARIEGTINGYGVLIVDGTLDIAGNFTFQGLVIARGDVEVQITGNAAIYGSLLIAESVTEDAGFELDVRGNATIQYDSCALQQADAWKPLPKKAKLLAWQESFVN